LPPRREGWNPPGRRQVAPRTPFDSNPTRSSARGPSRTAIELDPVDDLLHARIGFQLAETDEAESKRLQALAVEIGADDLRAYLGEDVHRRGRRE